ncbi:retroviral-like aspartic protease [Candidatus Woesearchaeota archaeon]|nr:retroviral-like aspartic protease [Candidatus Woesearchaeota archaeon]
MTMHFRYKSVKRPDGTLIKSPSIPIMLNHKEKFETVALLDSGADVSAIPKDVAEILGLDLNKNKSSAYGLGGKVESVRTSLGITIEKDHEHYNFKIPVMVILGKYDFPILLGRSGFFNEFIVTFNETEEKISLKKINKKQVA